MRLQGKVALISGGARGMGAEEARLLAREGAKVVIGDVLEEEGQKVEAEINETGGEALYVRLDVTREEEWRRAVETALARFGRLDVLVNNAGIGGVLRPGDGPVALEDAPEEEWNQVMDVNAKGVFLGTKHAIPAMRQAGVGPSSTSPLSRASWRFPVLVGQAHIMPPRAQYASSRSPQLSSTPAKVSAATPCIRVGSTPQ